MTLDLVVRGGMVIDGTGAPRYRSDVGVKDGRIVELGRIDDRGATEIDADGLFVTPGFIDVHTHLDAQLNWDPYGPSALHGVTSVVMGNCSYSMAPCRAVDKETVFSIFERAEDIPRAALLKGIEWRWETFPQWIEHLRRLPKGVNVATQVGHSALRAYVMGERAFTDEATDDDVVAMCAQLEAGIRAGAVGFSTNRSQHHWTRDDRPVPSRQASWAELDALVAVLGRLNHGVVQINGSGEFGRREWHEQVVRWAVTSRRPFFARAAIPGSDWAELYEQASAAGARLFGYWLAKPFDTVTGFRGHLAFDTLPGWKGMRALPLDEQRAVLADPERRAALVHEAMTNKSGSELNAEARNPEYDILEVLTAGVGPYKTVAEVAAERGITPVDAMIDLSLESDFHQLFSQDILTFKLTADMARDPWNVWGISDAGAHLAQSLGFDQTSCFLGRWVRDEGVFAWEEAIRLLCLEPAWAWGFADRGQIREGLAADLVVFDPDAIGVEAPIIDDDLPGSAIRLRRNSVGYHHTIVNGVETLRGNEPTGAVPGRVLPGSGRPAL